MSVPAANEPAEKPAKSTITYVQFRYGDPAAPTFTRFNDGQTLTWLEAGGAYEPAPEMEVRLPTLTGGMVEQPCEIILPLSAGQFVQRVTDGRPHSRVTVKVFETQKAVGLSSLRHLYAGVLHETTRHFEGKPDLCRLTVVSWKSVFAFAAGIACNHTCSNNLGGEGCGVALHVHKLAASVAAIDGNRVNVSAAGTGFTGQAAKWWDHGYLERDGLRVKIREWDGPGTPWVTLVEAPPLDWDGEAIIAVPGCDQLADTCQNKWNNIANFRGHGFPIPSFDPRYEVPDV